MHTLKENEKFDKSHYRVTIFGSARIKEGDVIYQQAFDLAKDLGEMGLDVVTGGGPGLMQAGNAGHMAGDTKNKAHSIGIGIKLPFEQSLNPHVEIERTFARFSNRLDQFMALSSAVVLFPGGVGTSLEFFYTWQLTQVKHICPIPIILVGEQWKKLIEWAKEYPLQAGLISPPDFDNIFVVKDHKEALKILKKDYEHFKKEGCKNCSNFDRYRLD